MNEIVSVKNSVFEEKSINNSLNAVLARTEIAFDDLNDGF